MKKYFIYVLVLTIFIGLTAGGCGVRELSDDKKGDVDYTVVPEEDLPETLKGAIAERMTKPFKLSYVDKDELYLVTGYGEQPSGGYSVVINDLYLTDNTIVFETTLVGPDESDNVSSGTTYPYIVVKTEYIDYEVVFK